MTSLGESDAEFNSKSYELSCVSSEFTIVNSELTQDNSYDLELNSASDSPSEVIQFIVETLQKIDAHETQL